MNEAQIQRAWDGLVQDVIEAKAERAAALGPLIAAEQAEAAIQARVLPFVYRGEAIPSHIVAELDNAAERVADARGSLVAKGKRIESTQRRMKAGVSDSETPPKKDK